MLDYRLLHALAAVIKRGSFEGAAVELNLTQSAVSQRIKQLETLLGQPVLIRSSPVEATMLGQQLHNHYQQVSLMEANLGLACSPQQLTLRLTVNADSLATWLPSALALDTPDQILFDILVEDQAVGLKRMRQGDVMACLCASAEGVAGSHVSALGALRYMAVASPDFVARYQLQTLSHSALLAAPCLVYNKDDHLQHQFLQRLANIVPQRIHYCPSSEGFVNAAMAGIGFGMMPSLQVETLIEQGKLVNIAPECWIDTPLFWHTWLIQHPTMRQLRDSVVAAAKRALVQLA